MTTVRSDAPIACSLEPGELSDRRAAWLGLAERALRGRHTTATGMQLVFAAGKGVEGELRELARLEARCCSFADWKVERSDDEVVLEVSAAGDGIAAVRASFDSA